MKIKLGQKLHGFTITNIRQNDSIGGRLVEMAHDKTDAKLCWLDNNEENKTFSIAFKTIPENSTGVFHILEHSVLCGSTKFQVREPFVELIKSSMNTFLNAMTYPDKTVYPVSSRNEKDYLNLAEVYLDAVFEPVLTTKPSVFHQEGWHYEIDENASVYNGVVLNEMKGAMSGIDDSIEQGVLRLIYPDTCYKYNSGGEPMEITELTYEQYLDTYKRFYHPSNSKIFLDGNVPLDKTLKMLDSYLAKYDKKDVNFEIDTQKAVTNEDTIYYEVDEAKENGDIITFAKIVCNYDEIEKLVAGHILCNFLASSNESPLKKALLENGLCEDVELRITDEIYQPFICLTVKNTQKGRVGEIRKAISTVISKILEQGIDRAELIASLNKLEFSAKQTPEPQGVYHATNALASWNYDGDPMLYLDIDKAYKAVREMLDSDAFEKLLFEIFGNIKLWSTLYALPSTTIGKEKAKAEAQKLESEIKAMSDEELKALKEAKDALDLWQQTPDSKQALESLPTLSLDDVNPIPELYKTQETSVDDVRILYHELATNGVTHVNMYFPVTEFSLEELSSIQLLTEMLTELPTKNYSVTELQREIKTYIGMLKFDFQTFSENDATDSCTPAICVSFSTLNENLGKAQEIVCEIINNTVLDNKQKMHELIKQIDEQNRQSAINAGHILGMLSVKSHYSSISAVNEALSGYTNISNCKKLAKSFDESYDNLLALYEKAYADMCKENMIISSTNDEKVDLSYILNNIKHGKKQSFKASYKSKYPLKMAIKIPSQVSYAVKGYHTKQCGVENDTSFKVAANILSFSYLWNKVRVQGGAYGTGLNIDRIGGFFCYSYRDPAPQNSLNAYDETSKYLQDFANDDTENLDNFIISTIASQDPLRTPQAKSIVADDLYLSRVTDTQRAETRYQALRTTREKLTEWCDVLDKMAQNGAICVVGNEASLAECKDLEIYEL